MDARKEQIAIQRLKSFEPDDGYYLCYSGGKDSDVIRILANLAGVKHENVHNLTTVDAPETVQYIKSLPDVRIDYPETTMWKLIEKMTLPPSRKMRYCCEVLKEHGGAGKVKITGVRWDESAKRAESTDVVKIIGKSKTTQKDAGEIGAEYRVNKQGGVLLSTDNDEARRTVELCYRTRSTTVNPIVDWTDRDVGTSCTITAVHPIRCINAECTESVVSDARWQIKNGLTIFAVTRNIIRITSVRLTVC